MNTYRYRLRRALEVTYAGKEGEGEEGGVFTGKREENSNGDFRSIFLISNRIELSRRIDSR